MPRAKMNSRRDLPANAKLFATMMQQSSCDETKSRRDLLANAKIYVMRSGGDLLANARLINRNSD